MSLRGLVEAALAVLVTWLLLRTWRRRGPPARPPTRMTEGEVLAAARAAVGDAAWSFAPLRVTSVKAGAGGVIWRLDQLCIGSGRFVEVDDATRRVLREGRWGVR